MLWQGGIMILESEIKAKILVDDRWLYRAILAIYDRQTDREKNAGDTIEDNGIGFNGCDGRRMSKIAEDLKKYGTLLPYKKDLARNRMLKYTSQLLKIAKEKSHGIR
jgi:hypothetical protein